MNDGINPAGNDMLIPYEFNLRARCNGCGEASAVGQHIALPLRVDTGFIM